MEGIVDPKRVVFGYYLSTSPCNAIVMISHANSIHQYIPDIHYPSILTPQHVFRENLICYIVKFSQLSYLTFQIRSSCKIPDPVVPELRIIRKWHKFICFDFKF